MLGRLAAAGWFLAAGVAVAAPATHPKPAAAVAVTNARAVPATAVSIGAGTKTVSISKPLAPNATATLKLPKMTGCRVTVAASFADESVVEEQIDVCKERTVRFMESE